MELRVNIPLDSEQKEASDKGNKHTNNLYRAKIYKDLYGMLGRGARTGLEWTSQELHVHALTESNWSVTSGQRDWLTEWSWCDVTQDVVVLQCMSIKVCAVNIEITYPVAGIDQASYLV